jgi:HK97 family phage prohead protease
MQNDIEFRPFENEHAARLQNPKKFDSDTYRRTNGGTIYGSKKVPSTIGIIWGKLKGQSGPDDKPIPQSLRFKTKNWTVEKAKKWLKDNNIKYILFEPAKEGKSADNEIERRFTQPMELRIEKQDDGPIKLVGYAAVFNKLSEKLMFFREKIAPGAFAKSLKDGDDVRALFNHDPNQVLGRLTSGTLKLKENTKGLLTEIDLPDTQLGRDLETLVERGDISGMSFGFIKIVDEWHTKEGEDDLRILKEVKLIDVSPVTYPAYPDTSVAVRSHELWKQENEVVEESEGGRDSMHMRLRLADA